MPDKTLVIIKITPKDMEKIDELVDAVKEVSKGEVKDIKREAIGFGIEVIKVMFAVNEKEENALKELEDEISGLEQVDRVEIEGMTLI